MSESQPLSRRSSKRSSLSPEDAVTTGEATNSTLTQSTVLSPLDDEMEAHDSSGDDRLQSKHNKDMEEDVSMTVLVTEDNDTNDQEEEKEEMGDSSGISIPISTSASSSPGKEENRRLSSGNGSNSRLKLTEMVNSERKDGSLSASRPHRRTISDRNVNVGEVVSFSTAPNFGTEPQSAKQGMTERERKMQIQIRNLEARLAEKEKILKTLTVEHRQMTRRVSELEQKTNDRTKTMYDERQRRIKANQEKNEIRSKLLKVQKMVSSRLKILGIDLANTGSMEEALDAALQAIQKLTLQLNEKEESMTVLNKETETMKSTLEKQSFELQKLQESLQPLKDENANLRKQVKESNSVLKDISSRMEGMTQEKTQLTNELQNLERMMSKTSGSDKQMIDRLSDKMKESEKRNEELKHTIEQLNKQVYALKEELSEQKAAFEKQVTQLEFDISQLQQQKLKLEQELESYRKKCSEQQKNIEELNQNTDEMKLQFATVKSELENKIENLSEVVDTHKSIKLQLENKVAELEDHCANYKSTIDELNRENEKMKMEIEQLKNHLKTCNDRIEELTKKLQEMEQMNGDKEQRLQQFQMEQQKMETENTKEKKQMNSTFETLKLESEKVLQSKNDELTQLSTQQKQVQLHLESVKLELQQANERWQAMINRPREDKEVQTTVVGADWSDILGENPKLKEQVKQLQFQLTRIETVMENLTSENKQLLTDMDDLIKKAAKFLPDGSIHKGEMLAMSASPTRFIVATSATDKTVRLWKIRTDVSDLSNETGNEPEVSMEVTTLSTPSATSGGITTTETSEIKTPRKNAVKSCEPYARSNVDSKVQVLCFSPCGKYLAAGTNYCDTPDGYVVMWSVHNDATEGYVVHAFRSRPTVRFGSVRALSFGVDGKGGNPRYSHLLFAGDVNGVVWCFNTEKEQLIGKIQHHKDVIYGIGCGDNGWMYSVSHDQHLCALDLSSIDCEIDNIFGAVIPINEVMREIIDSNAGTKTHTRVKSKGSANSSRRTSFRDSSPNPSLKAQSSAKRASSKHLKLKDDKEDEKADIYDNELPEYKGQSVAEDTQYPFWCIAVSTDGGHIVTGSRKLRVFTTKPGQEGGGEVSEPTKVVDTDSEHVKAVDCRFGMVVVTRRQVPRCKIFDANSGKELFKFACKEKDGGYMFAAFLCDRKHIVAVTQYLAKEPLPAVMRVHSFA